MLRKVYLEGEIGDKFGKEFELSVDSFQDALRCLDCNLEGFRNYLVDCADKGVDFTFDVAGEDIGDEIHLLLPVKEGDMTITAVPAGSKSGGQKILAAVAIAVITYVTWGAGTAPAAAAFGEGAAAAGLTVTNATMAMMGYTMAINLALSGIQQLMAPDPETDSNVEESYLFNGSQQNIIEGDPVPVLYGELRVPGRPISFEVANDAPSAIYSGFVNFNLGVI